MIRHFWNVSGFDRERGAREHGYDNSQHPYTKFTKFMYKTNESYWLDHYCCCLVAQSCPTLCNPMDCSPPGSSVHGISQASSLEWFAISFFRASSTPRNWTCISCIDRQILYHWAIRKWKWKWSESKSLLSDSLPPHGLYTVHGILQARILEWVAFPFSRGSSQPRDWTQMSHIAGGFFTSWATREAQEYWSGWPIPSPADLPNPGIELGFPALHADSLPSELSGKGQLLVGHIIARIVPFTAVLLLGNFSNRLIKI